MTSKEITSLVFLGMAAAYDISPVDIIPDIPIVGWIDDFLLTITAILNCIQQFTRETSHGLSVIARTLKWIVILLGGILIALVGLFVGFIVKTVS